MSARAPTVRNAEAEDRLRQLEVHTAVLAKAAGLVNVVVAIAAMRDGFTDYAAALILAGVVAAEGVGFCITVLRRGRIGRAETVADLGFICALLLVNAAIIKAAFTQTWGYFAYPYAIVSTLLYGIAFAEIAVVAAAVCAVVAAFLVGSAISGTLQANVAPNALSFLAIAPVTWLVARELRTTSRALDKARAAAEYSAAELSRERERTYHRRILHDRVLQTLELLDRTALGVPEQLREHIAAETVWLRHLVETGAEREPGDLLSGLDQLAATAHRLGLQVHVRAAQLHRPDSAHFRLPDTHVSALLSAAGEALANVVKHAQVREAVLRATNDGSSVTITVADAGRGFDPGAPRRGTGITRSIEARIAAVAGRVVVDSTPGLGTRVVLTVAAPDAPDAADVTGCVDRLAD